MSIPRSCELAHSERRDHATLELNFCRTLYKTDSLTLWIFALAVADSGISLTLVIQENVQWERESCGFGIMYRVAHILAGVQLT